MGYRGLVRMGHNSQGSKARVQCDGLMMDPESRSDTWPDIQIQRGCPRPRRTLSGGPPALVRSSWEPSGR